MKSWQEVLAELMGDFRVYAPFRNEITLDYQFISKETIPSIIYNTPIPVTPLKMFFLPVKENVTREVDASEKNVIIGVPSCDLHALDILDEIYLNEPFIDSFYEQRRKNTFLIGTDCFSILPHCHCTTYGITAYPAKNHDIGLAVLNEEVFLTIKTSKGNEFFEQYIRKANPEKIEQDENQKILEIREKIKEVLTNQNIHLPDYASTGFLIQESDDSIWQKYSKTCVSCGACATICPTCTCFLLVDRPGFEKIRQLDACQYPGFAKTAAGEDQLKKRFVRFRNRYLCKYVWKPEKFTSIACTGCGRCIDTCIGNISKNELFIELKNGLII